MDNNKTCVNFECKTKTCENIVALRENEHVMYCETCLVHKCITCCYNNKDLKNNIGLCEDCLQIKCSTKNCTLNKYKNDLCFVCIKK